MRIEVHIKTRAQENAITQIAEGIYKVQTKKLPIKGEANQQVIEIVAKHFGVSKSQVSIVFGHKNKTKVLEIDM